MTTLGDLFGADEAEWMTNPNRPCATGHPDDWFQPAADMWGKDITRKHPDWAKTLCDGCPVATQCLTYALDNDEQWGVWGGTTANERAAIRKKKKAA